jgi:outer membrane protein TolC
LAANRYQRDRAVTQLAALKQGITHEVRVAVRSLYDGAAAIDAAVVSSRLAVRNLEAEQTKFNNGLSTNFQVSEIQRALADAQFAEIRARVNYRKALAAYYGFTGTFLDAVGVQIDDGGEPESVHDYWKDTKWLQFSDLKGSSNEVTIPAEQVETASD